MPKRKKAPRAYQRWDEKAEGVMQEYFPHLPTTEIQKALPGRSLRSIASKANEMGLAKSQARLSEMARENASHRGNPGQGKVAPPS